MRNSTYRQLGLILIIVVTSLACNLVNQIEVARDSVQSVATDVQHGRDFIATARAIATQAEGSEFIKTAQALATQVGESGFLETAQAFATEQGSSLIETVQAVATEQGPSAVETLQALATRGALTMGSAPADIPLAGDERSNYIGTNQLVSYFTPLSFQEVLVFYQTQMPTNGWAPVEQGTTINNNHATLNYTKSERFATVTLTQSPFDNQIIVTITISSR